MTVVKYHNLYNAVGVQNRAIDVKLSTVKDFICDELIHGGHLLALGAPAIAVSTMMLLDKPIRWEFLPIVYLLTLFVYNYDHYKDIERDSLNNSNRTNHLKKYYKFLPLLLMIYGIGFFALLFYFGNVESFILGGLFLLCGLLYTEKFKTLTKKIVGFKNFYTSFSVALLTVFIFIYCSYPINLTLFILFIFMFLRFLVNTSFCDLKDIDADKKDHLLTIPVVFGKGKFLSVLHVMNIISFVPIILGVYLLIIPSFSLILGFSILYSFYYIQKAKNEEANIQSLSSIVVDGEFVFWPFIVFAGLSLTSF